MRKNYPEITSDFMLNIYGSMTNLGGEIGIVSNYETVRSYLQCFNLTISVILPQGFFLIDAKTDNAICHGTSLNFILGFLHRIAQENDEKTKEKQQQKCQKKKSGLKLK